MSIQNNPAQINDNYTVYDQNNKITKLKNPHSGFFLYICNTKARTSGKRQEKRKIRQNIQPIVCDAMKKKQGNVQIAKA